MESGWVLEFLIAGVDETGPHLWTITENGGVSDRVSIEFAAIGAGRAKAEWALARRTREFSNDLPLAIYAAFEAKKEAETTVGVGQTTDLVILRDEGSAIRWEADELMPLERVYRKMRPAQLPKGSRNSIQALFDRKAGASR
jgi:hypothetical protein